MTARDVIDSIEEGDAHRFGSMSEGYVYLYLRFHADRRGVFRLSMTELAGILNVNRQTILKHISALTERRLVMRMGHGRYRVFAESWSIEKIARDYLDSLPFGGEFSLEELERRAYGEENDLDWGNSDPRVDELCAFGDRFEAAGLVRRDAASGTMTRIKSA